MFYGECKEGVTTGFTFQDLCLEHHGNEDEGRVTFPYISLQVFTGLSQFLKNPLGFARRSEKMRFEAEVLIFVKHGGFRDHGQFGSNQHLCLILFFKITLKDYYIPIKTGPLAFKAPQFTFLKGFPTSSLCDFFFVFHLIAVPQDTSSISISKICSHSCSHLDAFLPGDFHFTYLPQPGQIPSLSVHCLLSFL